MTIPATTGPAITLVKSATRRPATPGAAGTTITYSYLVTNTGNVTARQRWTSPTPWPACRPSACPDRHPGPRRLGDLHGHLHHHPGRRRRRIDQQHRHGHGHPARRGPTVTATVGLTIPTTNSPAITLVKSASVDQLLGRRHRRSPTATW